MIRNIDTATMYIYHSPYTTYTIDDKSATLPSMDEAVYGDIRIIDSVNHMSQPLPKYCSIEPLLLEWFGVPNVSEYTMVSVNSPGVINQYDFSNHGAPERWLGFKFDKKVKFRPELFPSHFPSIWVEGLEVNDFLVIDNKFVFQVKEVL